MPTTPVQTIVLDSDGGVDDIAALWYSLSCPGIRVAAVTSTGGNVDTSTAASNLARITHLAGKPGIPIAIGEAGSFGPHPVLKRANAIHGDDGIGNTGRSAPDWEPSPMTATDLLAQTISRFADELTLVTLGPLTNVARLIDEHPDVISQVGQLVVMGGTIELQGNALPIGEANIAHDPAAAAMVATADWARPPLLVPLDATLRATFGPDEFASLEQRATAAAQDLADPISFYRRMGGTFSPPGESPCHDLTTVVVAHEPELVDAPVLPLGVDTGEGLAWGTTVVDRRLPFFETAGADTRQAIPEQMAPWRVALDINVEATRARYRRLFEGWDESGNR
ncbi:MAG: nucleoside hydrolase [Acidimicrobiaceae bacterium]|nr:nucleoside hydrolase [Acidimicrobiaceae bacterium]